MSKMKRRRQATRRAVFAASVGREPLTTPFPTWALYHVDPVRAWLGRGRRGRL